LDLTARTVPVPGGAGRAHDHGVSSSALRFRIPFPAHNKAPRCRFFVFEVQGLAFLCGTKNGSNFSCQGWKLGAELERVGLKKNVNIERVLFNKSDVATRNIK
jgi:hypothetical protein